MNKPKLLIACCGSVATIKIYDLVNQIHSTYQVRIILTQSVGESLQNIWKSQKILCYDDKNQESCWKDRGDPVLHIQLRKWADVILIAPLSANTLAKIANGLCDNLVSLVCRCWNFKLKTQKNKLKYPFIVCPAMNTLMWEHPITAQQLQTLQKWGITIIDPIQKQLMCGDIGKGAMTQIKQIIKVLNFECNKQ